jgi:type IV fimbrial biogenesis protein FimT
MITTTKQSLQLPAKQRGFTVVELVIAVVIVAILVTLALPSFRETAIRNNISSLNNSLIHTLNLARSEAVRRGVNVSVVSNSHTFSWDTGWSVTVPTGTVTTLSQQDAVPAGYSVCGKSTGGGADGTIVFTPLGALGGGATSFDLNVNRPDSKTALGQRLTVGGSGQVSVKQGTAGSPAAQPSC